MNEHLWIIVPGWEKFQHYGNRRSTPWLKVYTELNSRDEWRLLPYSERGLLVSIWLEYLRSGGQLRVSGIGSQCGQRVRLRSLQALNEAGFLHFSASKPLALRALAREEKIREEKKANRASTKEPNPPAHKPYRHDDTATQNPELPHLIQQWLKHAKPDNGPT